MHVMENKPEKTVIRHIMEIMDSLINYGRNSREQLNPENTFHSQIDNWCSILSRIISKNIFKSCDNLCPQAISISFGDDFRVNHYTRENDLGHAV